jgi:hypothetical protein
MAPPSQRIYRGLREDCPAYAHDTRWTREHYGCRCEAAVLDVQAHSRAMANRRGRGQGWHGRKIVWEPRDGCPAPAHDSRSALAAHGCRCPPALQDRLDHDRRHRKRHKDAINAKRRERERQKVAKRNKQLGRDPGVANYGDTEAMADWVMVERLIKFGPQSDATRYDRWMAISILTTKNQFTVNQIADRTGCSRETVRRYQAWMKGERDEQAQ